ncbi:MAG: hypothetical protein EOR30_03325 [Mesorhizobium sp.]|uniref:hypothetical protein n=1 Tax=unclassified Mesorhizobium TaxID=325217 RepID=UPI000FCCAE1A|nr:MULTISPECIES: hypothetical protein [unclassified Mesorhizobium]RUV71469.1 hypothetical protein EOA78_17740 [Mesorhizobium sp. M5C.F.Cr.IN.023.01.1.1]RWF86877.1 MAG: hypothetical protein EOQ36_15275 [Mesorhizobium sp.]RWF94683.1 MAG: hypothetical protein EOQ45_10755 [Mesorhizobium sp.]RWI41418.1 MAG: hypothetical protein EOR14_10220 [Mesorhizobium sp.]RWI49592.1 MAG: hypothetical protein EOR15_11165 [Mesorhizobium sp.]
MTMISDPDMPAIDIGPATHTGGQAVVGKPSNARMIGVVAVGALLITAVNITAAVYFYRGINDLRFVERRLEQLGSFEQRIAARLETVNNGFQSRFEKLDSQLQGSFNEVKGSIARLEQELPLASDDDMSSIAEPSVVTTSTMADAATDLEDPTEPSIVEAPRPPKKRIAAALPPAPNSSYQRIVQPDGKVHYKKIN